MEVLKEKLEQCQDRLSELEDCKKEQERRYEDMNIKFHEYMAATDQKIANQNKFYVDLKTDFKQLRESQEEFAKEMRSSLSDISDKIGDLGKKTVVNSAAVGAGASVIIAVASGLILFLFKGGF